MSLIHASLTAEDIMRQAAHTADYYLSRALEACRTAEIKPDPRIIAAYIHACTHDYGTSVRSRIEEAKLAERGGDD